MTHSIFTGIISEKETYRFYGGKSTILYLKSCFSVLSLKKRSIFSVFHGHIFMSQCFFGGNGKFWTLNKVNIAAHTFDVISTDTNHLLKWYLLENYQQSCHLIQSKMGISIFFIVKRIMFFSYHNML